jgi:hypothetical protein
MSVTSLDRVFVIHQNVDLERLVGFITSLSPGTVGIFSTHHLFPHELQKLRASVGTSAVVQDMADFLKDEDLAACDEHAVAAIREGGRLNVPPVDVPTRVFSLSAHMKNRQFYESLSRTYAVGNIYYADGLGISKEFWEGIGAKRLPNELLLSQKRPASLWTRLSNRFRSVDLWNVILDDGVLYVFFGGLSRLPIKDVSRVKTFKTYQFLFRFLSREYFERTARNSLEVTTPIEKTVFATTVHNYDPRIRGKVGPMLIFIDGYHPSNYPRSYVDYFEGCEFVERDLFSSLWFSRNGKTVYTPPSFLIDGFFRPPVLPERIGKVLLVLNHAGDWSALIHRSDTDRLVEAFCEVAGRNSGMDFIVRPHPTMVHPDHEGLHSIERLRTYVRGLKLPNLSVSEVSVAEDLERGDLFVSEYSQVLIDAYQKGKAGLICNLTGRRSFMRDFEDLGFLAVSCRTELNHFFETVTRDLQDILKRQAKAAERYNSELRSRRGWRRLQAVE